MKTLTVTKAIISDSKVIFKMSSNNTNNNINNKTNNNMNNTNNKTKNVSLTLKEAKELYNSNNDITYKDVCKKLFKKGYYYCGDRGNISEIGRFDNKTCIDRNNAAYIKQLDKVLALNQLLNIAEYYNRLHTKIDKCYNISYDTRFKNYKVSVDSVWWKTGLTSIEALFNKAEDAQAVIDNPNFREILDTIYKN